MALPELPEPPDPAQLAGTFDAGAIRCRPARFRLDAREREREISIPVAMRAEPEIPIMRAPAFGSEPDPTPAEFHELALEKTRSAIWPLILAVGIGLVVGFAGGYGAATRDRLMQIGLGAADPPAQAAPAQPAAPSGCRATPSSEPVDADWYGRIGRRQTAAHSPRRRAAVQPGPAPSARARSDVCPPRPAAIVVRSTPAGARVSVDGRDAGTTPATVRDLDRGSHTVRVTRDGYVAEERQRGDHGRALGADADDRTSSTRARGRRLPPRRGARRRRPR